MRAEIINQGTKGGGRNRNGRNCNIGKSRNKEKLRKNGSEKIFAEKLELSGICFESTPTKRRLRGARKQRLKYERATCREKCLRWKCMEMKYAWIILNGMGGGGGVGGEIVKGMMGEKICSFYNPWKGSLPFDLPTQASFASDTSIGSFFVCWVLAFDFLQFVSSRHFPIQVFFALYFEWKFISKYI